MLPISGVLAIASTTIVSIRIVVAMVCTPFLETRINRIFLDHPYVNYSPYEGKKTTRIIWFPGHNMADSHPVFPDGNYDRIIDKRTVKRYGMLQMKNVDIAQLR